MKFLDLFKRKWYAVDVTTLDTYTFCMHMNEYTFDGAYVPIRSWGLFSKSPFLSGFGPYETEWEAQQVCDFFNEE